MGRMIDADAFRRELDNHWPFTKEEQSKHGIADFAKGTVLMVLDQMPTIERKTGKWIEVEVFPESYDIYGNKTWSSEMQCDQCGFRHTAIEGHMAQYNYCPNCGADMRGEEDV